VRSTQSGPSWKVAKDESEAGQGGRLATILVTAAEGLRALAVLLNPVMPVASQKLWESLGAAEYLGELDAQPVARAGEFGQLKPGTKVTKGAALFPRLEEPTA
jgi:methionyl-tRNA synthetase